MAGLKFDEQELNKILKDLSTNHKAAFAAACCERMLPNYAAFSKMEGWGDTKVLREALDEIWWSIGRDTYDPHIIQGHIVKCESIVPDTEDFSSTYTSPALDAANAVIETLEYCIKFDLTKLVDVASFARDTVDMYIQDVEGIKNFNDSVETYILNHPLMVKELKKQMDDLHYLQQTPRIVGEALSSFKATSEGLSNIDIP